ncbi:lipopolysaccharide assembly protein LapB [Chitinophaga sp. GbtcB8]|uniref:tetratricopeptide repeat protein n=1 Tax=Chitinophaga sp. GbtcB8 TaxID=2824753 RepID=UPI001C30A03A|nr:hypothetical protein [Chitinophaga sp. GbtcB8]
MGLSEKLNDISYYFTLWVNSYNNGDLVTANARITVEAICKACIFKRKGDIVGERIINGKHDAIPARFVPDTYTGKLNLENLIHTIGRDELRILIDSCLQNQFEIVRNKGNNGSHHQDDPRKKITQDDLDICHHALVPIVRWFYADVMGMPLPMEIEDAIAGKPHVPSGASFLERWNQFYNACLEFDAMRYQYILVSPEYLSASAHTVKSFSLLPWRLVIDFNPQSDENELGLLYHFNQERGASNKISYTIEDKCSFDPGFPRYWFMANGQGSITPIKEFKIWNNKYKSKIADPLYKSFIKGSHTKTRIVVLVNPSKNYAYAIIDALNIVDEANLQFVITTDDITLYEQVLDTYSNVQIITISPEEIAAHIENYALLGNDKQPSDAYWIPSRADEKSDGARMKQEDYDLLLSLEIEVLHKGIANLIASDEENGFYRGKVISWRDLAEQKDIRRSPVDEIQHKIKIRLDLNKLCLFELIHEAGSGGTTVGRHIAWELSKNYPTVVVHKYEPRKTIDALRTIYDKYTKGSLPLLILIEAFEIRDMNRLYRDLAMTKKNAVIFVIRRGPHENAPDKAYLPARLSFQEVPAFESMYTALAPAMKERIKSIPGKNESTPGYITPVLYALTAYGDDYQGAEDYVVKCFNGISLEQKKLIGFITIIYNYTQRSVAGELFAPLFKVDRDKCDLISVLGRHHALLPLLHEEFNEEGYLNRWRPRYSVLSQEAMKIILGGGIETKENWKNNLGNWLIELIDMIKTAVPILDETTEQILNSLFIERHDFDGSGKEQEFTELISDVANPHDAMAIFEVLVNSYPEEAHFHGHYARYAYSPKVKDFEKAISEAQISLTIAPNNSGLMHTLGMCYSEKASNKITAATQDEIPDEDKEYEIRNLTDEACTIFDEVIRLDASNIYGYHSQISCIIRAINYGFKTFAASSKKDVFLSDPSHNWYMEKLDKATFLLREAFFLIEQSKQMDNRYRIQRSAEYILKSETHLIRTIGSELSAKNRFEQLINKTPSGYEFMRPRYKRMFVTCLLASKAIHEKDLFNSWSRISESELLQCIKYLNENIFDEPDNAQNIRLLMQAVRFLKNPPDIASCIVKISTWTQIAGQNSNSLLEGYYYLYVLNAIQAISEGAAFDNSTTTNVREILALMKPYVNNDRFCFEWLAPGKGIRQMLNHKSLGDFSLDFFDRNKQKLREAFGRIKTVQNSQQGIIVLDCGLEAFFVPHHGGFSERSVNDRVKFFVGFRYDQIQAWAVIPFNSNRDEVDIKVKAEDEEEVIPLQAATEEDVVEKPVSEEPVVRPVLAPPVVVGKIDLSSTSGRPAGIKVYKKQAPVDGNVYAGKVKGIKGSRAFIQCQEIDRNVMFYSQKPVDAALLKKLAVGREVTCSICFVAGKPEFDRDGRNYVAKDVIIK